MRAAYIGLGVLWLIVIAAAAIAANGNFTNRAHTVPMSSSSTAATSGTLLLTSSAFAPDGSIPPKYTCDGEEASPPLSIAGAPEGTRSFALIMEDPDVPVQIKPDGIFLHWVIFDIPYDTEELGENEMPGVSGENETGEIGYVGPCPPKEFEPSEHRYIFTLYALDSMLGLEPGATREEVERAMDGHILAEAQLVGRYRKL